jgi:DNA-binding NarL/FixJ family response regulator
MQMNDTGDRPLSTTVATDSRRQRWGFVFPGPFVSKQTSKSQQRIRVLVVEDHPIVRSGMRALINDTDDLEVCAEAAMPEEAMLSFKKAKPDLVSLDLMLGAADGFPLIEQMRALDPEARIIVVSMLDEDSMAEKCIRAGAQGYLMKSETSAKLLAAMRKVARGDIHLSGRLSMSLLNRATTSPASVVGAGTGRLSARETQVFQLIGKGRSTREIAEELGIGVKTVESHRENIKNKLRIEHSTALMREATRWINMQDRSP